MQNTTLNIWLRRHYGKLIMLIGSILLAGFGVCHIYQQKPPACQSFQQPFPYTLCQFDPANNQLDLSLAWQGQDNLLLLDFHQLTKQQTNVVFAMNAGMYDDKFAPIGYTVINGREIKGLNLNKGAGNFHLMPNGVFWWDKQGYHITDSQTLHKQLARGDSKPLFATQSGPMLVINGNIHPKFDPVSTSLKMRNGVGIDKDGIVKFVISDTWVNFYQFADLFKTQLHCDNALFLDGGRASALYSKELKRLDNKFMGVMLVANEK